MMHQIILIMFYPDNMLCMRGGTPRPRPMKFPPRTQYLTHCLVCSCTCMNLKFLRHDHRTRMRRRAASAPLAAAAEVRDPPRLRLERIRTPSSSPP